MSSDRVVRSLLAGTKDNPSHAAKFTIMHVSEGSGSKGENDMAGEREARGRAAPPYPIFLRELSFRFLFCHFLS